MKFALNHIEKVYRVWGRYPFLYKIVSIVTLFGRDPFLRKLAVQTLQLKPGDTVIDIACGSGLNLPFLYKAVGPLGKIIAVDYSSDMLNASRKKAAKNHWHNITFVQTDAARLSLDIQADGILSTFGFSAVPNHKEALKKALNLLKEGKKISLLEAKLPSGIWQVLNPLLAYVYSNATGWDYSKDIAGDLEMLIGCTDIEQFNVKTVYIVSGQR
ncbi:MAG: class I SAM-dependent methyltransferase [Bacteroidia bacterium]